jgi:hypothetical protein
VLRQLQREFRVCCVRQRVHPEPWLLSRVEIGVPKLDGARRAHPPQRGAESFVRLGGAVEEQLFRLRRQRLEGHRRERPHLRKDLDEERQDARQRAWLAILLSEIPIERLLIHREEKSVAGDSGPGLRDLVAFVAPGDARHLRNCLAHGVAIGADRKIHVHEQLLHLEPVGVEKPALQNRRRHLEPDEVVIGLGDVRAAGQLGHVERELHHQMPLGIVHVQRAIADFGPDLGIHQRHDTIDGQRMPALSDA